MSTEPTPQPGLGLPVGARVGIVCLHTDPYAEPGSGDVGGMNVVVRHVCTAMAALGVAVEVVTRHADPRVPAHEKVDGVTVHRLAVGPLGPVPKGDHEAFMADFGAALADLGPYDLLHSHHWFSGIAALPVARAWGVPHVQSFHSIAAPAHTELAEGERPESPGRLAGEAELARLSDAIVAVSHAEARTAVERLGADPARIRVVHPGVDTERFHPLAAAAHDGEPPSGEDPRPSLVVAARLEPLKGVDLAIRALAALPQPRPVLRVAGGATSDSAFVASLADLARDLGVERDVDLMGPLGRTQLADLMRRATLVLVPSHSETYGLVALEASASGVPVVAGEAGGLVEAVLDGVTGVLVPTRDPQDWAGAIGGLLGDPAQRARLGAAGRTVALRRTWATVAGATGRVYADVLHAHEPAS
ncbi:MULTISPECIES: glycosyltransferase [Miniimonas]|nr:MULTISPECIES: glycosyltransferase [Miniimonas]